MYNLTFQDRRSKSLAARPQTSRSSEVQMFVPLSNVASKAARHALLQGSVGCSIYQGEARIDTADGTEHVFCLFLFSSFK